MKLPVVVGMVGLFSILALRPTVAAELPALEVKLEITGCQEPLVRAVHAISTSGGWATVEGSERQ